METLLFALIGVRNASREREAFVPEPYKFQSFDLQGLRQVYRAKGKSPSQSSDRRESYLAQSVS